MGLHSIESTAAGAVLQQREAELERLASCVADGIPIDAQALATHPDVDGEASAGLRLIQRVALGFRRSLRRGADDPAPAFRFAGLEVFEKLGEGSYGDVYHARDPLLEHHVALKLRKTGGDALASAFLEEARCLARLRHPNIVNVYGAAIEDGRTGLWTELVDGKTLQALLATQGPLSVDEVRGIGRDLCDALAYIHRQGLTHGDVKPANVMRDDSGRVVLMDFGSARAARNGVDCSLSGSMRYVAPEVLGGQPPTARSDIFALGVTLFRLLVDRDPYPASDSSGLIRAYERGECAHLRDIDSRLPKDLCAAIQCAISADPAKRPRSATAFAAALQARPAPRSAATFALPIAAIVLIGVAGLFMRAQALAWVADVNFVRAEANGYGVLKDGEGLKLGDAFALEFRSNRPAYVYVIDDDGAQPAILFPAEGLDTTNPLAPETPLRLPGRTRKGGDQDWQVNRDAASEQITVVAATQPLETLETVIAGWQHADPDAAALASSATASLRGAWGLAPAPAGRFVATSQVARALRDLETLRARGQVRYWRYTFPHADHAPAQ